MRYSQQLQIILGYLFSVSVAVFMYFVHYPLAKWSAENNKESDWNYWIDPSAIFLLILMAAIPACSYLHVKRINYIAFGLLLILGGIFVLLTLLFVLVGSSFEGHRWIGILPGLLAFATIILAVINTVVGFYNRRMPS